MTSSEKAYRKISLRVHPDKNPGDPLAAENFQKLNQAYSILSNETQRKRYDRTGDIEGATEEFATAYEYYRTIYEELTAEDIEGFASRYRESDTEKEDLVAFYKDYDGDMTQLLEHIPCSQNDDVERFITFYEEKIADGTLESKPAFDETKTEVRLLKVDPEEAKEAAEELENRKKVPNSMADLEAMILKKKDT